VDLAGIFRLVLILHVGPFTHTSHGRPAGHRTGAVPAKPPSIVGTSETWVKREDPGKGKMCPLVDPKEEGKNGNSSLA
jgi:hypothetical protein